MEHRIKLFSKDFNATLGYYRLAVPLIGKVSDTIVIECLPDPPNDAPSKHHIARGCCDGTDIIHCAISRAIEKAKIVVDKPTAIARVKREPKERFTL